MSSQNISLPSGTLVEMAVLSADIEKSTGLPESLRKALNETLLSFARNHLSGIAPTAVTKVPGDGVLVITGDIAAIPKIASCLLGEFHAEANKLKRNDLKLRMGASFGRLTLTLDHHGITDADNCDAITRAVRIQSANIEAKELWCDEPAIQALIRGGIKAQISVLGKKEIPNFGNLTVFTVSEEVFQAALFRDITCFHQGHAIQYWCLASWFHRALKEAMPLPSERSSISDKVFAELCEKKIALQDFLRESLQQVALGTFEMLQKYFASRSDDFDRHAPRICQKGFDDENKVIDLVRWNGVALSAPIFQSQNSGFDHVVKTGSPFLCNDLITDLESYQNPRLNRSKVLELIQLKKQGHQIDKQDWNGCWTDGKKNPQNCYRSTLIIPLTLKNNTGMLEEFRQKLGGGIDDERMIYGTLCFDHEEPQFFRHEDIDFAYVAADWLSLYLLTQLNFTTRSQTFKDCTSLIQARKQ